MSAALLGGMQANATQQMVLFGRIEQRWGIFRYTLEEYHLSPDQDYPEFCYFKGLPILKDFYLEVHYEGSNAPNEAIRRVLKERRKTVYAMVTDRAAIVIDGPKVRLLGDVNVFTPQLETIE